MLKSIRASTYAQGKEIYTMHFMRWQGGMLPTYQFKIVYIINAHSLQLSVQPTEVTTSRNEINNSASVCINTLLIKIGTDSWQETLIL